MPVAATKKPMQATSPASEEDYQEYLDEVFDLTILGWHGTPFSLLLKKAAPVAYWTGYWEWVAEHLPTEERG